MPLFFGIDIHGNINKWSNKTAEITGYSKEEAFNQPLISKFIVHQLRPIRATSYEERS